MSRHTKAILLILLAGVGFSLMTLFVRLSGDLPVMEKAFFRNAVSAVVAYAVLLRSKEKFSVKKDSFFSLLMRSCFGAAGLIANFYAIDHLNIADANILNKLSPFFAILMSAVILSEIPKRSDILSVLVALLGAAIVVRPTRGLASFPALIGLFGGFAAGTAYTFLRKVRLQGERGPVIIFFFSMFSVAVCLPGLILHYQAMSMTQFFFLLLAGTAAAVGQFCITKAYSIAPAREISVFDYSQVLFAALWGILFFSEYPGTSSLIGYALILGAAIFRWEMGRRQAA